MNKIIKISVLFLAAVMAMAGCQKEIEFETADKGPELTIVNVSDAEMGGDLTFKVALKDPDFALSTLTAKLYFEDAVVAEEYIQIYTNEAGYTNSGEYEGALTVPFLKNIPDGQATVKFEAVNIGQGVTVAEKQAKITRPKFEKLILVLENGTRHDMTLTENYNYEVEGDFDALCKATIESPVIKGTDRHLTFGYGKNAADETVIIEGGTGLISFSNSVKGYKIFFNTKTFDLGPFLTVKVNGKATDVSGETYSAVLDLTQGSEFKVEGYEAGFADWVVDPDYIEAVDLAKGVFKFLPIDGKYKVSFTFTEKYFRFEAMKNNTELATLNLDGTGAIWLIGSECVGKPVNGKSSWNPEEGGICLAQHSPLMYQVTLVAGTQLNPNDVNFKFFFQKSWGGEFGGGSITSDSELFYAGESDGNIHLNDGKFLAKGVAYKFIVDLTKAAPTADGKGVTGAVLHVEYDKTQVPDEPVQPAGYAINGTAMEMVNPDEYKVTLDLTQGQQMAITGISDITSYYIDPDFVDNTTFKWNATAGKYRINVYLDKKYAKFTKVKEDGSDAKLEDGALWMMAWGLAHPVMTQQFAFDEKKAFCMAEVSPKVFQLTGIAVDEKDGETVGGRFRYDYLSFKYFFQNAWGGEMGFVEFVDGTDKLLKQGAKADGKPNNLELADGVQLEKGATYRLTIDLSESGKEKVKLVKL